MLSNVRRMEDTRQRREDERRQREVTAEALRLAASELRRLDGSVPASIHWTHSGHHNEDLTRRVEPRGAGKRRSQRAERWELRGKLSSGQVGD